MINYESNNSSTAVGINEIPSLDRTYNYTFTGKANEEHLYNELNARLKKIERATDMNRDELNSILSETEVFQLPKDEKEELNLRFDWLDRLYHVKENIETIKTRNDAEKFRRSLSSVQTCPMKSELMSELTLIEESLPEEDLIFEELSNGELLKNQVFEEGNDAFINLGTAGREYIIKTTINEYGEDADTEKVIGSAIKLEKKASQLTEISDRIELAEHLNQLPLVSYSELIESRKEEVVDRLIEVGKWNGLAHLDRQILHIDRAITKEELEVESNDEKDDYITLSNGIKMAYTIDIGDLSRSAWYSINLDTAQKA